MYNIADGGDGGNLGADIIEKIRKSNTGKKHTLEQKQKISQANIGKHNFWLGKKQSQDHINKRCKHLVGNTNPSKRIDVRNKISVKLLGVHKSEQHKQKVSDGLKRYFRLKKEALHGNAKCAN